MTTSDATVTELDAGANRDDDAGSVDAGSVDAGSVDAAAATEPVTLRVERSARFDSYLVDDTGRALYQFAGDTPGAQQSACLGACALEWPAFDWPGSLRLGQIERADIGRFHRQDGAWQLTYKGRPLYHRATEAGSTDVSGDAAGQRWFVARDYAAFLTGARMFVPAGGNALGADYLTDGAGFTLYVCLDDRPGDGWIEAVSSCDRACLDERPIAPAPEDPAALIVPSLLERSDLDVLVRPDGARQLTYRGWPLYYFRGDAAPGATEGHNDRAWRAIDPIRFGVEDPNGG